MLSTVLNIIMFEDCRNQWSMSRPLLGLILLNEEYFKQLRDQVYRRRAISNCSGTVNILIPRSFNLNLLPSRQVWPLGSKISWKGSTVTFLPRIETGTCSQYFVLFSPTLTIQMLYRFTQNLSVFRRDINDSLKGPNVTTSTVNEMMTS